MEKFWVVWSRCCLALPKGIIPKVFQSAASLPLICLIETSYDTRNSSSKGCFCINNAFHRTLCQFSHTLSFMLWFIFVFYFLHIRRVGFQVNKGSTLFRGKHELILKTYSIFRPNLRFCASAHVHPFLKFTKWKQIWQNKCMKNDRD